MLFAKPNHKIQYENEADLSMWVPELWSILVKSWTLSRKILLEDVKYLFRNFLL